MPRAQCLNVARLHVSKMTKGVGTRVGTRGHRKPGLVRAPNAFALAPKLPMDRDEAGALGAPELF